MGLLDRVVKKAVGDVLADKASDLIGQVTGQNPSTRGQSVYPAQQAPSDPGWQPQQASQDTGWERGFNRRGLPSIEYKDHAWFATMLKENFSEYLIREYVPVAELGGDGKPYDFLLIRNGAACGAIMLTEHNKTNNRAFKGAKAACQAAGVPFINFFDFMANEPGYVINRIRGLLK